MYRAGHDDRTLTRIAAMLVALAVLAERSGSMPFPVRWIVLVILRRAETVAHEFVVEATQTTWPYLEEYLETGNRPVDAAFLGWRLRLLAEVLRTHVRLARGFDCWNAVTVCAPRCLAPSLILMSPGGWQCEPCDTS